MKTIKLLAAVGLMTLVVFQSIVIYHLEKAVDDSQWYIDYWRHKTDSLYDVNHCLWMQWIDMRDSLITIKYK